MEDRWRFPEQQPEACKTFRRLVACGLGLVFSHVGSGRGSEVSSGVIGYVHRFRRVRDRYCFELH